MINQETKAEEVIRLLPLFVSQKRTFTEFSSAPFMVSASAEISCEKGKRSPHSFVDEAPAAQRPRTVSMDESSGSESSESSEGVKPGDGYWYMGASTPVKRTSNEAWAPSSIKHVFGAPRLYNEDVEGIFNVALSSSADSYYQGTIRLKAVPAAEQKSPEDYLKLLFLRRGLNTEEFFTSALENGAGKGYCIKPTAKMVADYDIGLVQAVRTGNLELIDAMYTQGKSMNACNKYGESVLHMACRKGDLRLVRFLLARGACVKCVDDFGRTPLHDACWAPEPCFDLVLYLLNLDLGMATMLDRRGASPLAYARQQHRAVWCAFLEQTKGAFFQPLGFGT